jgi:hypothetical protein
MALMKQYMEVASRKYQEEQEVSEGPPKTLQLTTKTTVMMMMMKMMKMMMIMMMVMMMMKCHHECHSLSIAKHHSVVDV